MIENHNLHGFDLPFLDRRARISACRSRSDGSGRPDCGSAPRGAALPAATDASRRVRFVAPGRELIDTLDAVLRYDFSTRELPGSRPQGGRAAPRHRRPGSRVHPRRPDLRGLSHAIRSACAATPPPTSRRSRRSRACSAARRSRSRRWRRAATSGSPMPARRPA